MKRARLIMNPISGDDQPNLMKLPDIVAALEVADIRADLSFTQPDTSPGQMAQQAVEEGYDLVVVGGGDGTVSEVAKALVHAPIPLGILPIGTYNNIARSLNLPSDMVEACRVLAAGQTRRIDVGQMNDEYFFLEAAGVGLDAALFPLGEAIKGGRWGRIVQAAQLAMTYKPQKIRIQLDRPIADARDRPVRDRLLFRRRAAMRHELRLSALFVVIANGPYYGAGFTVAPDAVIDDGLLTVSLFRNFSKWELVRHFWSINRGQQQYHPKIETYHVAELTIDSPARLPIHIDGHSIGEVPATFKVVRQALSVMVPDPLLTAQNCANPLPMTEFKESHLPS